MMSQLFSLPLGERYLLAQQLLDSIEDKESEQIDGQILSDLLQRRDEMLRGEQIVVDWRDALGEIENSLSK